MVTFTGYKSGDTVSVDLPNPQDDSRNEDSVAVFQKAEDDTQFSYIRTGGYVIFNLRFNNLTETEWDDLWDVWRAAAAQDQVNYTDQFSTVYSGHFLNDEIEREYIDNCNSFVSIQFKGV